MRAAARNPLLKTIALVVAALLATDGAWARLPASRFKPPLYIYRDAHDPQNLMAPDPVNHGAPSGWMGDYRDLIMQADCKTNPHSGNSCIAITYTANASKYAGWAGMIWQCPANNGGELDGGYDLTGARKLSFWARGEKGGEFIEAFKFGGTLGPYPDSGSTGIYRIALKKEWTYYEIDLTHCDTSYISGLFLWAASKFRNPRGMTFYLDDIKVE